MSDLQNDRAYVNVSEAIESASDVSGAVQAFREAYDQIAHVTYHIGHTFTTDIVDAPFVRTTYPEKWIARYLTKGYVSIDPIVRVGFSQRTPFLWSEIEPSAEYAELFQDFHAHGFGLEGYSMPVSDKSRRTALVSINAKPHSGDWNAYVASHQNGWVKLAQLIHNMAIKELYGQHSPIPQISPREVEVLQWVSKGKGAKDIAAILGISEHTVRSYALTVRSKLDCTNLAQAVAKAARLRLI
jgi:DNA-binding CsgD family transcriptional regulator